jgi:hypothetical protein
MLCFFLHHNNRGSVNKQINCITRKVIQFNVLMTLQSWLKGSCNKRRSEFRTFLCLLLQLAQWGLESPLLAYDKASVFMFTPNTLWTSNTSPVNLSFFFTPSCPQPSSPPNDLYLETGRDTSSSLVSSSPRNRHLIKFSSTSHIQSTELLLHR